MSQPVEPRPAMREYVRLFSKGQPELPEFYGGFAASNPSFHGGESISGQTEEVAPIKEGKKWVVVQFEFSR